MPGHPFEVLLESVHYDDFVSSIEFMGQLMRYRVKFSLHVALLGINIEQTVSLVGESGDIDDAPDEGVEYLHVRRSHSKRRRDLCKEGVLLLGKDWEEMSIRVPLYSG